MTYVPIECVFQQFAFLLVRYLGILFLLRRHNIFLRSTPTVPSPLELLRWPHAALTADTRLRHWKLVTTHCPQNVQIQRDSIYFKESTRKSKSCDVLTDSLARPLSYFVNKSQDALVRSHESLLSAKV